MGDRLDRRQDANPDSTGLLLCRELSVESQRQECSRLLEQLEQEDLGFRLVRWHARNGSGEARRWFRVA